MHFYYSQSRNLVILMMQCFHAKRVLCMVTHVYRCFLKSRVKCVTVSHAVAVLRAPGLVPRSPRRGFRGPGLHIRGAPGRSSARRRKSGAPPAAGNNRTMKRRSRHGGHLVIVGVLMYSFMSRPRLRLVKIMSFAQSSFFNFSSVFECFELLFSTLQKFLCTSIFHDRICVSLHCIFVLHLNLSFFEEEKKFRGPMVH